jgi:hypothetical protein
MKPREKRDTALWGFIGVVVGSVVSGFFSLMTSQMAYQASENSAARAQQSSERTIQEENNRARDEFLRDQRISVYKQYLTDSTVTEAAQLDYFAVLSQPASYPPAAVNSYFADMETKNRQFVNSAWGFEFFSTEKLKEAAGKLTQELYARHLLLRNYDRSDAAFRELAARIEGGREKMAELRRQFTESASEILSK